MYKRIIVALLILFLCIFFYGCTKKEEANKYWAEKQFRQHKSYVTHIEYFYDESVDICYGVTTSYYKLGLVVVPYEKVKHKAIIVNPLPESKGDNNGVD